MKKKSLLLIGLLSLATIAIVPTVTMAVLNTNKSQTIVKEENFAHVMQVRDLNKIQENDIKNFLKNNQYNIDNHKYIKHEIGLNSENKPSIIVTFKVINKLPNNIEVEETIRIFIPYELVSNLNYEITIDPPINVTNQDSGLLEEEVIIKTNLINKNNSNISQSFHYVWKINNQTQANNGHELQGKLFNKFGNYQISVDVYQDSTLQTLLASNNLNFEINKNHIDKNIKNNLENTIPQQIHTSFTSKQIELENYIVAISEVEKLLDTEAQKYSDYKIQFEKPELDKANNTITVAYNIKANKYSIETVDATHTLSFKVVIKDTSIQSTYAIEFNKIVSKNPSDPEGMLYQIAVVSANIKKDNQIVNDPKQFGYIWEFQNNRITSKDNVYESVFFLKYGTYKIKLELYEDKTFQKLLAVNDISITIDENNILQSTKNDFNYIIPNQIKDELEQNVPVFNVNDVSKEKINILFDELLYKTGIHKKYKLLMIGDPIVDSTNQKITINYRLQAGEYGHQQVLSKTHTLTFKYNIVTQSSYIIEITNPDANIQSQENAYFYENVKMTAKVIEDNYPIGHPDNAGFRFEWYIDGVKQNSTSYILEGVLFKKFGNYKIDVNVIKNNTIVATQTKIVSVGYDNIEGSIRSSLETFKWDLQTELNKANLRFKPNDITQDNITKIIDGIFPNLDPENEYKWIWENGPIVDKINQKVKINVKFQVTKFMPDQEVYSKIETIEFGYTPI